MPARWMPARCCAGCWSVRRLPGGAAPTSLCWWPTPLGWSTCVPRARDRASPGGCAARVRVGRCWPASGTGRCAGSPPTPGPATSGPDVRARAAALAAVVDATQTRADAAAGRWAGPGGPADRRVLDALCLLSLQAVSAVVEADIRRLGLLCGIGRETARTALLHLARDGWVTRNGPAEGPRAASWILNGGLSTVIDEPGRSQADPRPPGAGTAERNRWLTLLRICLGAAAHDVFTFAGGLGHATGQLYATLNSQPASTSQLAHQLGYSPDCRPSRNSLARPSSNSLVARGVRSTGSSLGWLGVVG